MSGEARERGGPRQQEHGKNECDDKSDSAVQKIITSVIGDV